MSEKFTVRKEPAKAEDITPEWVEGVKLALIRDNMKCRRGPDSSIEIESKNGLGWCLLNLPGETSYFVSKSERDIVFNLLLAPPIPKPPAP